MTVLEALGLKHPDPCAPPDWILPSRNNLPLLEDLLVDAANAFNSLNHAAMLPCCFMLMFFSLDVLVFLLKPIGDGRCWC